MRKGTLVITAVLGVLLVCAGRASANFAIHGNYAADTDACAGCHRAHTAQSPIAWTDAWSEPGGNALLLTRSTTMEQFCYTCHGPNAPGAATDVDQGELDAGPIMRAEVVAGEGLNLNGGGFTSFQGRSVTSKHSANGATGGIAWGAGSAGPGRMMTLDCSSCHDPHGTSNYRLLKDRVNGYDVGGYLGGPADVDPTPTPHVLSNEQGFPLEGFRLHREYPDYRPNYTVARYARPLGNDGDPAAHMGMTGWCTACHEQYALEASAYDHGDGTGGGIHYRHPTNVPLSNWYSGGAPRGDRALIFNPRAWRQLGAGYVDLPLEHNPVIESGPFAAGYQTNSADDFIGCLTCHRAHGTSAAMSGYSNVADSTQPAPNTGGGGVPPTGDSALLRADNRGVCERCHNK